MTSFLLQRCQVSTCKVQLHLRPRRPLRLLCALSVERSSDSAARKNKPSAPAAAALSVVERDVVINDQVQNAYEAGYQASLYLLLFL